MRSLRPIVAVLLIAVAACASEPSHSDVVVAMVDEAIIPGLTKASESIGELASKVEALCDAPSEETLDDARETWREARQAWRETETALYFGPADMMRSVPMIDYWPVSTEGIDELVASETPIDRDYIENRAAATQRGLGAIEYVLFDDGVPAPRSCDLAEASAGVAADHADRLARAWTEGLDDVPAYRSELLEEMEPNDVFADVVGSIVDAFHRFSSREIGTAIGATASDQDLRALPDGPSTSGADDYVARLNGIETVLTAGGDDSLLHLIRARSPEVAASIETAMDEAVSELEAFDQPMADLAAASPSELEPLFETLLELHILFEADVVSALDITLGFSDTDGDSG